MPDTTFKREKKTDKPVIALCYDFDKTLSLQMICRLKDISKQYNQKAAT